MVVLTWWWKKPDGTRLFEPVYLERLRDMLSRHLHRDHQLVCATDDPAAVPGGIGTVLITEFKNTPRCRRRIAQYNRAFAARLGTRILSIDLDVVIVDDITPLVDRREPLVLWKVGYAGVYSGSFQLYDFGALHGLYERFRADPERYPRLTGEVNASDQAMLNLYIRQNAIRVAEWTEADGLVTYFGEGYEKLEHHGVGPNQTELPPGARIVVLGSADKHVLDEQRFEWAANWR